MAMRLPLAETRISPFGDPRFVAGLRRNPLRTDDARVREADTLTPELLETLRSRRICAIHVRGYCAQSLAKRADRWIMRNARPVRWHVGRSNDIPTDMSYGVGIPRQQTLHSRNAARVYARDALLSIRRVREAFAPHLSPMDRLRLELGEIWTDGVSIEPFERAPGFVGLVRIMRPDTVFEGKARRFGVCHVDSSAATRQFSSNIYLHVPRKGGELRIWNVSLDRKTERNPIYELLKAAAFAPDVRECIAEFLPEPLVIRPEAGDLVILDTSRPHAVAGFSAGHRVSIQAFFRFGRKGSRHITMWS